MEEENYENEHLADSLEDIWRIAENNLESNGDDGLAVDLKNLFSVHVRKLSENDRKILNESMESWGA
jgi:hypothetical protein